MTPNRNGSRVKLASSFFKPVMDKQKKSSFGKKKPTTVLLEDADSAFSNGN